MDVLNSSALYKSYPYQFHIFPFWWSSSCSNLFWSDQKQLCVLFHQGCFVCLKWLLTFVHFLVHLCFWNLGINDKNLWTFPHLSWALAELLVFYPTLWCLNYKVFSASPLLWIALSTAGCCSCLASMSLHNAADNTQHGAAWSDKNHSSLGASELYFQVLRRKTGLNLEVLSPLKLPDGIRSFLSFQ